MLSEEQKILISAYYDNALSETERAQVENLLAKDPQCRAYLDEIKKLSSVLPSLQEQALSPDAEIKIRKTIYKESSMNTSKLKYPAMVLATLVVCVLVFQNYAHRALQSRVRDAGQYMTSQTTALGQTKQYEPYYQPSASFNIFGKGVQGKMKSSSHDIADQYSPNSTTASRANLGQQTTETSQVISLANTKQYEPYYQQSSYNVQKDSVDKKMMDEGLVAMDSAASRLKSGYQTTNYERAQILGREVDGSVTLQTTDQFVAAGALVKKNYPQVLATAGISEPMYLFHPYPVFKNENTEEYKSINDNQFLTALENPLSTFSIDVDTASYSNVRRFLLNNQMPPADAVRVEEMVNYFSYNYPNPKNNEPFSITTNMAVCPWNNQHQLLHIGLKGRTPDAAQLSPSNLVFLIDVSGSMDEPDKMPLLKDSFKMMINQLRPQDKVSIVVYAGNAGLVLPPTYGDHKEQIIAAIDAMQAGGSTAGGAGMQFAYQIAKEQFISGGNNRVVWATDGDFNVGTSDTSELVRLVEGHRQEGVFLTLLGFGQGNYKDGRMQQIADKGNGNYYYIDNLKEARKVLVNELGSVLFTIAKDVKIQIEFNPSAVQSYRLIGYEKRLLAKEDFNNDKKDAGEIGAGHTVTALYEIVPAGVQEEGNSVDPLKYQKAKSVNVSDEVMTVKLRYKQPNENTSKLITRTIKKSQITNEPTGDFAWASSVAEFGMLLRNSEFKGSATYDHVLRTARANINDDRFGLKIEFITMVENAENIAPSQNGQMQFK